MKFVALVIITLAFLIGLGTPMSIHSVGFTQSPNSAGTLTILKLKTNATGLTSCTVSTSSVAGIISKTTGTLFGNIRIVFNMTWTKSNGTYDVNLGSFFLVVTQANMVVSNSTNINQDQN